ncbi:MAG: methyltransferase domain-containing protein [Phycisphaerae bacterium]
MATEVVKEYYQDSVVARDYDAQRFSNLIGRTFDRLEKKAIQKSVRRTLAELPNPNVLDVPCGTGRITELLLDMGLNVVGGDISPQMIDVAREKCSRFGNCVSFRQLDLDDPALPENSFDLVICIRLMHHLDSDSRKGIFKTLSKMTRRFVMVNVSYMSPIYRIRRVVKRMLRQGISRECSTWPQILEETAQAGLRIEAYDFVRRYLSEDMVLLLRKT